MPSPLKHLAQVVAANQWGAIPSKQRGERTITLGPSFTPHNNFDGTDVALSLGAKDRDNRLKLVNYGGLVRLNSRSRCAKSLVHGRRHRFCEPLRSSPDSGQFGSD